MEEGSPEAKARVTLERLARRLRQRRREMGLSVVDIAERSGVSHSWVSRIERGLVPRPTLAELEAVAPAYGYTSMSAMLADDAGPVDDVVARVQRESPALAERLRAIAVAWDGASPTAQAFSLAMLDTVAGQLATVQGDDPGKTHPQG